MAIHLPPTRIKGMPVVRYALLAAESGHRSVAVVAQQESGTTLFNVLILASKFADKPWQIEKAFPDMSEMAATGKFREYEQRG
jgi:hypothetical protein